MSEVTLTEETVRNILSSELEKVKKSVVDTMMQAVGYKCQKIQDDVNRRNEDYITRFV